MIMGNAFPNCNGSSALYVRVAVGTVKVEIWNKEPLMIFRMCLWKEGHIYVKVLQLFTVLPMPFALNAMTLSVLWTLVAILFHKV
jgi:hypothetical protein